MAHMRTNNAFEQGLTSLFALCKSINTFSLTDMKYDTKSTWGTGRELLKISNMMIYNLD